jgi:microcystin-dependent protein
MSEKPVVAVGDFIVGTVIPYAAKFDPSVMEKAGWLNCDGRALSRTAYADLFSVIGVQHGAGDGVNTFNLPDYRGYFLRGVDDGTGRDPDTSSREAAAGGGATGDACGSRQGYATKLPKNSSRLSADGIHSHAVEHLPQGCSSYAIAGSYQAIWNDDVSYTDFAGQHSHKIVGGDKETRPLNIYVYYLIKAFAP